MVGIGVFDYGYGIGVCGFGVVLIYLYRFIRYFVFGSLWWEEVWSLYFVCCMV